MMITECLSQTQIVTNLLRLQNTTFQTCSRSKYSPIIPRLIFKATLFSLSLSPPTTNPRTSSNRERERETQRRWGEHLNLAFREWSGRCLEIFHILFTPGTFQPRTAESWQGLWLDTAPLSLFYLFPASLALKISVCKPFHSASFLSTPSNPKQTRTRLARCAPFHPFTQTKSHNTPFNFQVQV